MAASRQCPKSRTGTKSESNAIRSARDAAYAAVRDALNEVKYANLPWRQDHRHSINEAIKMGAQRALSDAFSHRRGAKPKVALDEFTHAWILMRMNNLIAPAGGTETTTEGRVLTVTPNEAAAMRDAKTPEQLSAIYAELGSRAQGEDAPKISMRKAAKTIVKEMQERRDDFIRERDAARIGEPPPPRYSTAKAWLSSFDNRKEPEVPSVAMIIGWWRSSLR